MRAPQRRVKTLICNGPTLCGEGGIRTHGTRQGYNGFRDRPVQPLRHLSQSWKEMTQNLGESCLFLHRFTATFVFVRSLQR